MIETALCTAPKCNRPVQDISQLCDPCTGRLRGWLAEIPTQLIVLRASRHREIAGDGGRTGTRTPPLPGSLETLNLLGPGAWTTVHDEYGDQHGPPPIATVLHGWVRLITEERRWDGPDIVTEEALADWLAAPRRLDWALRQDWAGDMYDELDGLMRTIRGVTRTRPRRRPVDQPCPRCDFLALVEEDHQAYIECGACQALFTPADLAFAASIHMATQDVA